jgi:hypothetical protein
MVKRTTLAGGATVSAGPDVNSTYPLGCFLEDYVWQLVNGDLDEFNGCWTITPEYPSGTYAYFTTVDSNMYPQYPFVFGSTYYGISSKILSSVHSVMFFYFLKFISVSPNGRLTLPTTGLTTYYSGDSNSVEPKKFTLFISMILSSFILL